MKDVAVAAEIVTAAVAVDDLSFNGLKKCPDICRGYFTLHLKISVILLMIQANKLQYLLYSQQKA